MTEFILKSDTTFEAEDIDDAFLVLSEHFRKLNEGGLDSSDIFESGFITIKPINRN